MDTAIAPENHQEFAKEYLSSLVDLTYNSKPLIDMLTILAEENIEHGQVIVNAVELHISKVAPEFKLPVLYLIDSIVKNVGREYTDLFSHSIVNIFYGVFRKVNEKVRAKMFSLRQTWNEVFTQPKLYALDLKVNGVDPAWPITAKVAPAIHVNPNFLKSQQEKDRQAKLIEKQLALIELENRKSELEMAKKFAEKQQNNKESRFSPEPDSPPEMPQHHQPTPMQIANPNRTRVAPVNPLMIARMRDPRVARAMLHQQQMQQQHLLQQQQNQLQMLAIQQQQSTVAANELSKRNAMRPSVASNVAAIDPQKSSEQHAQILAELDSGIKDIREQKQRIAHKSPTDRTRSNSTSKSTVSSTSTTQRTKSGIRNTSKTPSSSKASSSSGRERSERRSDTKSTTRRSSSEGVSDRKKSRTNSTSSPKSDQKSPKRSTADIKATSSDSSPPKTVRPKSSLAQKYSSYLQRNRNDNGTQNTENEAKDVSTIPGNNSNAFEKNEVSTIEEQLIESKKRDSEERVFSEEPLNKKTKSEKIDLLFGSEDVDLRTLMNPMHVQMAKLSTPPPSQTLVEKTLVKNDSPNKLDNVRAKLAEASKLVAGANYMERPRTSENQDVDLRSPILTNNQIMADENSQDTKYNMIVSQAHHQLDNEQISLEQYNTLIKQVMQVKTQQKRESLKRKNDSTSPVKPNSVAPNDDDTTEVSSTSGSGTESESTGNQRIRKRDRQTSEDSASDELEKKRTRDRPRKTKWSSPPCNATPISTPNIPIVLPTVPVSVPPPSFPIINPMAMPPLTTQMPPNMWPMTQAPPNIPFNPTVPPMWQQPPQMPIPPMMMGNPTAMPIPIMPPPMDSGSRSITIDGIPREIRFYGEIAIAFMGELGNEPREIGFQAGERRILVDNKDAIRLAFNDTYTPFTIDGITYQIRFGTPIRELYINNQWFECLFGDQSFIPLAGKPRVFQVEGPSPQVRIGLVRKDLVAGKVDLYIDSTIKRPFFLDSMVQHFDLDGQIHTLQFADYFLSVLVDGEIFSVQYGSMPKRFRIGGRDRFIRFSVLPNNMVAGSVYVRNMIRTDRHRNTASPTPQAMLPEIAAAAPISIPGGQIPAAVSIPNINIDDLFQKLVASGILNNKKSEDTTEVKVKAKPTPIDLSKPETLKKRQEAHIDGLFTGMQCSSCGVRFPPEQTTKYSQHLDWHFRQNRRDRDSARKAHSRRWYYDVADWVQYEEIEDLDDREKNWFETQQIEGDSILGVAGVAGNGPDDSAIRGEILETLPSCVAGPEDVDKTCDMCHDQFETFYNEETEDWHLRNAVRGEEGATYHPICYEDYKNSLTLDRTAINMDLEATLKKDEPSEDVNIILDDEDDDVIVMPTEEPVVTEIADEEEPKFTVVDDDESRGSVPKTPDPDADALAATSTPAPVSTLPKPVMNYEPVGNESDLQILVPQISVLDLDEYEEKPEDSNSGDSNQSEIQLPIKIKEEPRKGYNDEEEDDDDGFEEVGTIEGAAIIDDDSVDILLNNAIAAASSVPSTVIGTQQASQSDMTSLDGNVQPQDALPAGLPTTNRIKINITKNVSNKIVINTSENTDKSQSHSELNSCDSTAQPGSDPNAAAPTASDSSSTVTEPLGQGSESLLPNVRTPEPELEIDFDIKESMRNVSFQRMTLVKNGLETSGLCSIM